MKSLRFAFFFVTLVSMFAVAQSTHAPIINQPNGLSRASLTPRKATVTEASGSRGRALPMQSGLNFAPVVTYGSGGYNADSVAIGDLNGDGIPDIAVANFCLDSSCSTGGGVGVLLGNGDGTFQSAVAYDIPSGYLTSIAIGDVNGDGRPDLVVAGCPGSNGTCSFSSDGFASVLLGKGDGTFQSPTTYNSAGIDAISVAIADVNEDGKADLLILDQSVGSFAFPGVAVLLGNGNGGFNFSVTYGGLSCFANGMRVADLNNDGKPDIVVSGAGSSRDCGEDGVTVLLGNGDGTFGLGGVFGPTASSLGVGDVNGDGNADIVVSSSYDEPCCGVQYEFDLLLGNGKGGLQYQQIENGYNTSSTAIADVNGDGKADIVTSDVSVFLGNGNGTFQPPVGGFGGAGYVVVADVNADGKPDIVGTDGCCAVGILINISTTATATSLTSSLNPSNYGQAVTFTATVTAQAGFSKGTPTGNVSFFDGNTSIGNSNLNSSGVATLMISTLLPGTHNITATYNGDAKFAPSTSPVLNQVVQGSLVSLSPSSLNFGNQTVGTTSSAQNVTLQNIGNATLTITSIQITGTNSGDFAQTNNCPSSLAPNGTCMISVTFTPTVIGTRNASVSITDNAPGSPQSVPLSGTGIPSTVTFSPSSLNFGNQPVGTTSSPLPVKLTTNGTLNVSSISVSSQFNQTNNCPSKLSAGGSCTINVTFTPSAPGPQNGTLSVSDDGQNSPQTVPLSGTGTQPAVSFNPPSLNFSNQTVGLKSTPLVSTLTNTGAATLTITQIQVTGANHADFVESNNCPASLAPNANCTVTVTFTPTATGTRSAAVSVTDNAPGSPQSLPLAGVGVLPAVMFSPSSLTFPTTVVFSTSAPQKVTLTNTGLGILVITSAKISPQFGVTTDCGKTLASAASCAANVTFKPTTKGPINGSISLTDNASNSPQQVPLSGTGTFVQLTPPSLNFGTQPVNTTSVPKVITLVNKGDATVNFTGTGISIGGADPNDFAQTNDCGASLASGAHCYIKVTFTPTQLGMRSADVSVSDDGGGSPQIVPVSGTGTP